MSGAISQGIVIPPVASFAAADTDCEIAGIKHI